MMAAACLISLEDWQEQLANDHENARFLIEEIANIKELSVDKSALKTNIFYFSFAEDYKKYKKCSEFTKILQEKHQILLGASFEDDCMRIVTHRDVQRDKCEALIKALKASL